MSSVNFFDRVAVILVEPENTDNIGAAARAMKNMGFKDLRLVKPPLGWRRRARKMAVSAGDTLAKAEVFRRFEAAIRDRTFVIATTRRRGPKRGIFLPFFEMTRRIREMNLRDRAALVFGKESKGLDNQTLRACDWVTTLPSHPIYPSLNVAQAVMICVFSLFSSQTLASAAQLSARPEGVQYLSNAQVQRVLKRFKVALGALGYRSGGGDKLNRIAFTLHGLIKRSGLLQREAQMLRGLSRRIVEKMTAGALNK